MSSKRAVSQAARRERREARKEQRLLKQRKRQESSFNRRQSTESNIVSIDTYKSNQAWKKPTFKALTPNHYSLIEAIRTYPIVIVNGPAGSLKTYLSLETSLEMVKEDLYEYIIYVRQDIDRPNERPRGALPGTESEKFSELIMPIEDNLRALVPPGEIKYLLSNVISGSRIDTIRGRSPLNTIIIADEAQNMDYNALKCVMTRAPEGSMLILAGDYKGQKDLQNECFNAFRDVCLEFNRDIYREVCVLNFKEDDILRNDINKSVIRGFENINERNKSI